MDEVTGEAELRRAQIEADRIMASMRRRRIRIKVLVVIISMLIGAVAAAVCYGIGIPTGRVTAAFFTAALFSYLIGNFIIFIPLMFRWKTS